MKGKVKFTLTDPTLHATCDSSQAPPPPPPFFAHPVSQLTSSGRVVRIDAADEEYLLLQKISSAGKITTPRTPKIEGLTNI